MEKLICIHDKKNIQNDAILEIGISAIYLQDYTQCIPLDIYIISWQFEEGGIKTRFLWPT